jgi:hypothetical protein
VTNIAQSAIHGLEPAKDFHRCVPGGVVDANDLDVLETLPGDGLEAIGKVTFRVVHRHDHTDEGDAGVQDGRVVG